MGLKLSLKYFVTMVYAITKEIDIFPTLNSKADNYLSQIPVLTREELLVRDINLGKVKAFDFLYNKYYNELCVFALKLVNNSDEAEDIVQNVMVTLWEKRQKFTITKSIKSYLYKSVYYGFINTYRKKKKEISALNQLRYAAMMEFTEYDDTIVKEKIRVLNIEIERLPKKGKEIFLLAKRHGLKYREIAEELNISIKTVESQMSRAMKKIASRIC